jgi:hypothetical protein
MQDSFVVALSRSLPKFQQNQIPHYVIQLKNEVVLTLQDNLISYGLDMPAELLSFRQFFRQVFELNWLIFRLGNQ